MTTRVSRVGSDIVLTVRFYKSGVLFDPYNISDVSILNPAGTVVATASPAQVTTGVYNITWSIPLGYAPGYYNDRWTWIAESGMSTKVQAYTFRVDAALAVFSGGGGAEALRGQPGRLFISPSEIDFFDSITKELIQSIIGQKIIYYSISEEKTNTHRLYDEALKKTSLRPVSVNALILYNEPLQTATQFSIDTIYSIECYFHIHELRERNIIPREGDFVKFGDILYEIEKLNKPQIVYGQVENQVMHKAVCRVSRKSQFEVLDSIQGR